MRRNFGAKPWTYPQPIIFDAVNHTYHVMGEQVGRAFRDGLELK